MNIKPSSVDEKRVNQAGIFRISHKIFIFSLRVFFCVSLHHTNTISQTQG